MFHSQHAPISCECYKSSPSNLPPPTDHSRPTHNSSSLPLVTYNLCLSKKPDRLFPQLQSPRLIPNSVAEHQWQLSLTIPHPTPISWGSHRLPFLSYLPHCFLPDPNNSRHFLLTHRPHMQKFREVALRTYSLSLFPQFQSPSLIPSSIAEHP